MSDFFKKNFTANSAVYNITKGLIFNKGELAFRVSQIFPDQNNTNLQVENPKRLKYRLFKMLISKYNNRIDKYSLNYPHLGEKDYDKFNLVNFKLSKSTFNDDFVELGGSFEIFPLSFVCKKCGDLQYFDKPKDAENFDPNKCKIQNCNGKYEQVSVMHFCEKCGEIDKFKWWCKEHKSESIGLIRPSKDSLATWRVKCRKPGCKIYSNPADIFRSFQCKHFQYGQKIANSDPAAKSPLTVRQGNIFLPVTDSFIDIPKSENVDIKDLEYLMLGIYLGLFQDKIPELDEDKPLDTLVTLYESYHNQTLKNYLIQNETGFQGKSDNEIDILWEKKFKWDILSNVIDELRENYKDLDYTQNLNDFGVLVGQINTKNLKIQKYEEYLLTIVDPDEKLKLINEYELIKNEYKIENIYYVPRIKIISSSYAIILGINKFWEGENFTPHYEPIWNNPFKKESFLAYIYPFETEGVIFNLDKIQICTWLHNNNLLETLPSDNYNASKVLLNLNHDQYNYVYTLLHTLCHVLMRRSSLYTGLDDQSCSEIIFPLTGAFFIYSTNSINIGGFSYAFEHEMGNWFKDIKYDVIECTLDPSCMNEKGACFSCLYLPEFVCTNFNQLLDRSSILTRNKQRFNKGFWD